MRYFLYKITNRINGKMYIGKTANLDRRWREHQKAADSGKQHPLYDSIRKHGMERFVFEVIQETTEDKVDQLEKKLIEESSIYPLGYNLAKGGTGGDTFTNLPKKVKERKRALHRAWALDNPKGISTQSKKGKHITEIRPDIANRWKAAHSKAMKRLSDRKSKGVFTKKELEGYSRIRDHWKVPDHKHERSLLSQGKNNGRWLGYLEVYSKDGILINVYESAKEAGKSLGIPPHTVREKARSGKPYKCKKPGFEQYIGLTFKFNKQ
jgi:group I intron endonuclease